MLYQVTINVIKFLRLQFVLKLNLNQFFFSSNLIYYSVSKG